MHGREHATAYAVGALKLLGAKPKYPLSFIKKYQTAEDVDRMLRGIPWDAIWSGSHVGSGLASAPINTGEVDDKWVKNYLDWLDKHADSATGHWLLRSDGSSKPTVAREELGGAFHFYYIYTYVKRPLPYPQRIIDSTLPLQQPNGLYDGEVPYCIDLDGVFDIIRPYIQDGKRYRTADVNASVGRTLDAITVRINDREFLMKNYRDSHKLVGAIVALAEIQLLMPERLKTQRPLKRVLDFSPFI